MIFYLFSFCHCEMAHGLPAQCFQFLENGKLDWNIIDLSVYLGVDTEVLSRVAGRDSSLKGTHRRFRELVGRIDQLRLACDFETACLPPTILTSIRSDIQKLDVAIRKGAPEVVQEAVIMDLIALMSTTDGTQFLFSPK
jgi:hypothetical protein